MKVILIILAIFLAFRLFFRYVVPHLLIWFVKKEVKKHAPQQAPEGKEGDIHIHRKNTDTKGGDEGGKYIDFEEVDE